MAKTIEFITALPDYANEYIKECIGHCKEVATGSGKIVVVEDRHIPTIAYFLNIWLPLYKMDTITRDTYYVWRRGECKLKSNVINTVDELFQALAADIVANEGKGIFYAKNKLGWTDKVQSDINQNVQLFTIDPLTNATDNLPTQNSITE